MNFELKKSTQVKINTFVMNVAIELECKWLSHNSTSVQYVDLQKLGFKPIANNTKIRVKLTHNIRKERMISN